ncbi:hypothetical protein BH11MYX3_BH11MYX3_46580 [soil metagenome]
MSSSRTKTEQPNPFMTIDSEQLAKVAGGAARITARASGANSELTAMLTSIGDSIKSLAANPGSSGSDPMQMMMMMMMMGGMGGGGGGGAPAAAAAPPPPPTINISTDVKRGC